MANVYISPTGNDSTGNGTSGNPWLTINKGFTGSSSGDTINALAGTYTWSGSDFDNNSGSFSASARTLLGPTPVAGFPTAIFDAGASTSNNGNAFDGWTIQNMWFRNATIAGNSGEFAARNGGSLTFLNCVFSAFTLGNQCGIIKDEQFSGATNATLVTITGCLFFKNSLTSTSNKAAGCVGLQSGGTTTAAITNSSFYNVHNSGATNFIGAVSSNNASNIFKMINCIFMDGGSDNPTFWINGWNGAITGSLNNCVFGYSSVPAMTGTVSSDPLFVDVSNNNYNLRPTSPCIDAGTAI
jgi:hypothetical protein